MADNPLARRVFAPLSGEDGYSLTWKEKAVRLEARHLRRDRHELIAEVAALCDWAGARTFRGSLVTADLNLSSAAARKTRAKDCLERSRLEEPDDFDWHGLFEEFCVSVIMAERAGAADSPLVDLPELQADHIHDINGFPVLLHHPMVLFGDGGSAKSYLALWLATKLAETSRTVLYLDWEFTGEEHRDRLKRLTGEPMPRSIRYLRCERPITEESERIRRLIREQQVSYVICDSVAFAVGGAPEKSEMALGYFAVVRQFGIGSLHIAHVNKSEHGDQRPFGSTFWHNSARATWYLQRATDTVGETTVHLAAYHRKANTGRLLPALGFRLSFEPTRTLVQRQDVGAGSSEELSGKLPVWQRMKGAIESLGPTTPALVAEEIGSSVETVTRTARRMTIFTQTTGDDGQRKIALATSRREGF